MTHMRHFSPSARSRDVWVTGGFSPLTRGDANPDSSPRTPRRLDVVWFPSLDTRNPITDNSVVFIWTSKTSTDNSRMTDEIEIATTVLYARTSPQFLSLLPNWNVHHAIDKLRHFHCSLREKGRQLSRCQNFHGPILSS